MVAQQSQEIFFTFYQTIEKETYLFVLLLLGNDEITTKVIEQTMTHCFAQFSKKGLYSKRLFFRRLVKQCKKQRCFYSSYIVSKSLPISATQSLEIATKLESYSFLKRSYLLLHYVARFSKQDICFILGIIHFLFARAVYPIAVFSSWSYQ